MAFPAALGLVADTARGKVVEDKRLRVAAAAAGVEGAWVALGLAVVVPAVAVVVRRPVGVAVDFVDSSRISLYGKRFLDKKKCFSVHPLTP